MTLSVEQTAENEFAIRVTDTGIGIDEADLEKIFELYYQVNSNRNKSLGSGIGLSISKAIAQLMGGDLTVTSEIGHGSTFLLTFKAEEAFRPSDEDSKLPLKLNILLVEDIEVNVVVAKSLLEKLGYQSQNLSKIITIWCFWIFNCRICQALILPTTCAKTMKTAPMTSFHR